MSSRNTLVRSLHDLGAAAWFGGTLMGVVGLNGATAEAEPPSQRLKLSSLGWARSSPVQLAAIIAHGAGGVGLILGNRARLASDPGARANTVVKLAVTAVALGATLWSGLVGRTMAQHAEYPTEGVTEPAPGAPVQLASAQRQQRIAQWVVPAAVGTIIVLAAQQGEQQRPVAGIARNLLRRG